MKDVVNNNTNIFLLNNEHLGSFIKNWKGNLKLLWVMFVVFVWFSLTWCKDSWIWGDDFTLSIYWFDLEYNGNIRLEKVQLKTDDLDEIVDLYQEIWDSVEYRDSLLIAKKYAQWLWANAFVHDNLDILEEKWLVISDIRKTQVRLKKYWENVNAVLVEYKITEWLIDNIPQLYVSQLFIPKDYDMILMSFITENKSSYLSASNMFKNIK